MPKLNKNILIKNKTLHDIKFNFQKFNGICYFNHRVKMSSIIRETHVNFNSLTLWHKKYAIVRRQRSQLLAVYSEKVIAQPNRENFYT